MGFNSGFKGLIMTSVLLSSDTYIMIEFVEFKIATVFFFSVTLITNFVYQTPLVSCVKQRM